METPTLEPRWYQLQANDAVWNYLAEKQGNCVVVLPTGAGKSLLIALLIRQALEFGGRVVVLAHRKELLQQNADEIRSLIPGVDVGIYSAGLKSKEIHNAVVVAGIQSVFRKAVDLGRRHLVLVDECHLISDLEESMYQQFFAGIAQEGLRIVGLTATAFRTGTGPICGPDRQFQRIVFEAKTAQLITEGFLCPITNKVADCEVNTDNVALRGGEFVESEMQAAFGGDKGAVVLACNEVFEKCRDRKSILIFASGVSHAEDIAIILGEITRERVGVVTGETLDIERATMLSDFKAGRLRWSVRWLGEGCGCTKVKRIACCWTLVATSRGTAALTTTTSAGLRNPKAAPQSQLKTDAENNAPRANWMWQPAEQPALNAGLFSPAKRKSLTTRRQTPIRSSPGRCRQKNGLWSMSSTSDTSSGMTS
jgi:superfamily II DNA or RNA helicase